MRRTFRSLPGKPFSEWKWKKALAEGVVEGTAWKPVEWSMSRWRLPATGTAARLSRAVLEPCAIARPPSPPAPAAQRSGQ